MSEGYEPIPPEYFAYQAREAIGLARWLQRRVDIEPERRDRNLDRLRTMAWRGGVMHDEFDAIMKCRGTLSQRLDQLVAALQREHPDIVLRQRRMRMPRELPDDPPW